MPDVVTKMLKNCPYNWDFQGKYVYMIDNEEPSQEYQAEFFVMKSEDKWLFRTEESYLSNEDGFVEPYVPPKLIQKFEYFQGIKLYRNDKEMWVDEEKFYQRYNSRLSITRKELFEKFKVKYETVFNWLCVSFDRRETFWKILKNDYENNVIDTCFEVRLDEIVCSCISIEEKYWKIQKSISLRKKRTKLFLSEIFKNRRTCDKWINLGISDFKHRVL
jgi:hypothetical protein